MSWPRGSLFTALLVLSIPLASADTITVNTTTDDYADNSLCSLREAVEYFNLDKPKDGFQGCKTAVSSENSTITLPANKSAYLINSRVIAGVDYGAIFVRRGLSISGAGVSGDSKTRIQVVGPHRAFIVSADRNIAAPACYVAGNCMPAGAPVLDPGSDTGALPNDFLTPVIAPTFAGVLDPVPTGTTVRVTLYRRLASAEADSDPIAVGSVLADEFGNWSITSTSSFKEALHRITYTVTVDDADEGEESPATQLAVYNADNPVITLTLSAFELQGCGTDCANIVDTIIAPSTSYNGLVYSYPLTSTTAGKGGLIYSNETLDISAANFHAGVAAVSGGAIHAGANGLVALASVKFSDNKAASGGAIYAEKNSVFISQSLFVDNTDTAAGAAVVSVAAPETAAASTTRSQVVNSTFSGNHGVALSLRTGAVINASTIVLNEGGLRFNGQKVGVYNTILAGNPDNFDDAATPTDCLDLPASSDMDFQFSLGMVGGGCGVTPGLTLLNNTDATQPGQKLMASVDAKGVCTGYQVNTADGEDEAFEGMGLLCPLGTRSTDEVTATHLPRLLGVYVSGADSPILGKGSNLTSGAAACPGNDQRSKSRRAICDIGAVEVQPVTGSVSSGGAISYGQTHKEAMDSALGDEQLYIPTSEPGEGCPAFAMTQGDDLLKPGCPWIVTPPTKGRVVFNTDGTYTYTPGSDYHGFDRFSFRVVTAFSKLNDTFDTQSRVVNAQIIVEPGSGISPYSTSGSADLWLLFPLAGLGLAGLRRAGRGEKK